MRLTRIVATLGPASLEPETISDLIDAGVDVFRCNFAHGTPERHKAACEAVREAGRRTGRDVALMQELCGPKIRIEEIEKGGVELIPGQETVVTTAKLSGNAMRFSCSYKSLPQDVRPGDRIFINDGNIELEVLKTAGDDVYCKVRRGGMLASHASVNLPGVKISDPSVTPQDLKDLAAGQDMGFDYVSLSFVRSAEDVLKVRRVIEKWDNPPLLLAKIERPEALEAIDAIIAAADGIVIARGDLAVELAPERVPVVQQDLIRRANAADKLSIVATQMLESMKNSLTPPRSEVNDVAIAVYEGADAVMLSAETSIGSYPVAAVQMVAKVAAEVEKPLADNHPQWNWKRTRVTHPLGDAVSNAAYGIYKALKATAIVAYTHSGRTGLYLSKCRPFVHLVVFTRSREVARKMRLFWGVEPIYCSNINTAQDLRYYATEHLRENNLCAGTDNIIIVSGNPFGIIDHSNTLEVTQLSGNASVVDLSDLSAKRKGGKKK